MIIFSRGDGDKLILQSNERMEEMHRSPSDRGWNSDNVTTEELVVGRRYELLLVLVVCV
jgi:hypothetical protein